MEKSLIDFLISSEQSFSGESCDRYIRGMANLTPERRMDKTGKVVTRHVRAQETTGASRSIPAPKSSTETRIAEVVSTVPSWGSSPEVLARGLRHINRHDPSLFTEVVNNYLASSDAERSVWRNVIDTSHQPQPVDEAKYWRAIEMMPLSVVLFPDAPPGFRAHKILIYGEEAEEVTGSSPGEPDYDNAKAWVIIREVEKIDAMDFENRSDEVAFIGANLEAVMPLIPELIKRKTASSGVVRELLDAEVPAIRDGVL
jgi:hypothetical protein